MAEIHPKIVAAVKAAAGGDIDAEQEAWTILVYSGENLTTEGRGKNWKPGKRMLQRITDAIRGYNNKERNARRVGRKNLVLWQKDWLDDLPSKPDSV